MNPNTTYFTIIGSNTSLIKKVTKTFPLSKEFFRFSNFECEQCCALYPFQTYANIMTNPHPYVRCLLKRKSFKHF